MRSWVAGAALLLAGSAAAAAACGSELRLAADAPQGDAGPQTEVDGASSAPPLPAGWSYASPIFVGGACGAGWSGAGPYRERDLSTTCNCTCTTLTSPTCRASVGVAFEGLPPCDTHYDVGSKACVPLSKPATSASFGGATFIPATCAVAGPGFDAGGPADFDVCTRSAPDCGPSGCPLERPPGVVCQTHAGEIDCPAGFGKKKTIAPVSRLDDTRSCGCACMATSGSCTSAKIAFYSDATCTAAVDKTPREAACDLVESSSATHVSYDGKPDVNGPGCEPVTATAPIDGGVTSDAWVTLCCP